MSFAKKCIRPVTGRRGPCRLALYSALGRTDTVIAIPTQDVFHVCLAGRLVSNDWDLIRNLRSKYLVTLVDKVDSLARRSMLKEIQVLVLDCSRSADAALNCLAPLKQEFPNLCVVLVDGGLNQTQIATAFSKGVKDYFASPYDVALLVERMDSLCTRFATRDKPQSH